MVVKGGDSTFFQNVKGINTVTFVFGGRGN